MNGDRSIVPRSSFIVSEKMAGGFPGLGTPLPWESYRATRSL